jgi:hypothetical protein
VDADVGGVSTLGDDAGVWPLRAPGVDLENAAVCLIVVLALSAFPA